MMNMSNSTLASAGLGVPVALILAWILNQFVGVEMPGEIQAASGAVISSIIGYFFAGGRKSDVE